MYSEELARITQAFHDSSCGDSCTTVRKRCVTQELSNGTRDGDVHVNVHALDMFRYRRTLRTHLLSYSRCARVDYLGVRPGHVPVRADEPDVAAVGKYRLEYEKYTGVCLTK